MLTQTNQRLDRVEATQRSDKQELLGQIHEVKTDLKEEIREVKHDVQKDREKLQQVYESRDRVTVSFGRMFPLFNAFISAIVAIFVVFFTKG